MIAPTLQVLARSDAFRTQVLRVASTQLGTPPSRSFVCRPFGGGVLGEYLDPHLPNNMLTHTEARHLGALGKMDAIFASPTIPFSNFLIFTGCSGREKGWNHVPAEAAIA